MEILIFAVTLFLTDWLNAKFIKDASGKDQYWHTVQLYQQIWIYLSYGLILLIYGMSWKYLLLNFGLSLAGWGFCYMLLYNSLLNVMRRMKITHLGRYDFFSFGITVVLFVLGVLVLLYRFRIINI